MNIQDIATKINGKVIGDAQHAIKFPAKIEDAQQNNITFLANIKYLDFVYSSNAGCIVISSDVYNENMKGNFILVDDAYSAFSKVLSIFNAEVTTEISDKAFIHPSAKIGIKAHIYPFVYIRTLPSMRIVWLVIIVFCIQAQSLAAMVLVLRQFQMVLFIKFHNLEM